jgi:hypothetical protein
MEGPLVHFSGDHRCPYNLAFGQTFQRPASRATNIADLHNLA